MHGRGKHDHPRQQALDLRHRQNARQRFGEVLKHFRERRNLTTRRVADMCGVSRDAIENYEAGHTVPSGKVWDKYKGILDRRLGEFAELRQRALEKEESERASIIEAMARQNRQKEQPSMATPNGHNQKVATNLGERSPPWSQHHRRKRHPSPTHTRPKVPRPFERKSARALCACRRVPRAPNRSSDVASTHSQSSPASRHSDPRSGLTRRDPPCNVRGWNLMGVRVRAAQTSRRGARGQQDSHERTARARGGAATASRNARRARAPSAAR